MGEIVKLKDHRIAPDYQFSEMVQYEFRPVFDAGGKRVKLAPGRSISALKSFDDVDEALHAIQITLDNPCQLNSYTTEMIKDIIIAFQRAGMDRRAVAVVLTGAGDRAFCTGGNTEEYAEYYAGRPMEYGQYMWLFNMMVNSILLCQLPVICRVNGMRVAGGQEIGMACDFTIAGDHAVFGQAGPRHGSAPIGGSTDFLPLFVGIERAMNSAVLCENWNARQAKEIGLITDCVPVYKDKTTGEFIDNPFLTESDKAKAKERIAGCEIDLSLLDQRVDRLITQLLYLMPGCVSKTVDEIRRVKWEAWSRNFPGHRQWLALNMLAEGKAGFRAFDWGDKRRGKTVDFVRHRELLAEGNPFDDELIEQILPPGGDETG